MKEMRDITAEQQDTVDELLARYGQTEDNCNQTYQRRTLPGGSTKKTGAVILSFNAPGKVIKGIFRHQFTIREDGSYSSKTQHKKGV